MPLSLDGPRCMCGMTGCWEAYISNLATLSRYFGRNLSKPSPNGPRDAGQDSFTVTDLAARARGGDATEHHSLGLLESGLEWSYVTELRERWNVPVVVKGLVTAEDATLAVEHGASAVVVSNHGGRQLDATVASLDALPEVVEAVGSRAEVYLDGGVRRGTDVVMALGLGARAVLVGRPAMYGLGFGGSRGVAQVLEIFREETENALALLGCRSALEVTRTHVTKV
jgi:isopentenyl diphosphate isomerase/L-lactate dehydrogenase-like FMN-dependent dehydrogenase